MGGVSRRLNTSTCRFGLVTAGSQNVIDAGRLVVIGHSRFVEGHHGFLCLTFLVAAIATSVKWRKPATESERDATGVTQAQAA